ncbi:MAG TPA: iron-containing alcohol dehydrogenase [Acidobacteriota bacterium]|nr:iron-containing alcohol dehydrogenase [Acidobacteriota bacterium]
MRFEFSTATRIIFGPGTVREAVSAAASLGNRALIVTGGTPGRLDSFFRELNVQNIECTSFSISGEPTIDAVLEGVRIAKDVRCKLVIGCGGGSALDGAKAIAALSTNPGSPLEYLEIVGSGKPLTQPAAPCICIPTTAGTGCEVTRNAVLVSPEHHVKVSLRSNRLLPLMAVVDPELAYSLPPDITAATGMDALTQLIEPFVCNRANPLTDALCRDGIRRVARWLQQAVTQGTNFEARENMALASLFGGLALTNAGLGAVHGFAAPMGGMFPIPHGIACACLLPFVMDANLKALGQRSGDSDALARYEEIARIVTQSPDAKAKAGVDWIHMLRTKLSIPHLSTFGITEKDLTAIAAQADRSSSIKGNPVKLTQEELTSILRSALRGQ